MELELSNGTGEPLVLAKDDTMTYPDEKSCQDADYP
jgi:hypothetical protein